MATDNRPPPASLDDVLDTLDDVMARLTRVETRLVTLMGHLGMKLPKPPPEPPKK